MRKSNATTGVKQNWAYSVQHMEDDKRANREQRYGRLSGFWGNLPGRVWMLVEMGGDVSIKCLTAPCIGCHVARQQRQRSHRPGGRSGVTVCPKRSPRQHGVQIGEALLRRGQPRGDPILRVWASGDCVLTSVNPTAYRSAENKMGDSQQRGESVTCVWMYV